MLQIDWVHPVYKPVTARPDGAADGKTAAVQVERSLPLAEAYAFLTDGDRRPLLVLRECERCKGTDHALLSRSLDNEQTVLLTYWFRCVKLPPNTMEPNHPFAELWKPEKPGDRIPHLFFADPDGSNRRALPGDQQQSELWNIMFDYLERCYDDSAREALKELRQLLSQYDRYDLDEQLAKTRIDKETEKHGPRSPKLATYEADLVRIEKARTKLAAKEKELRELALRELRKPAKGKAGKAGKAALDGVPAKEAPATEPPAKEPPAKETAGERPAPAPAGGRSGA